MPGSPAVRGSCHERIVLPRQPNIRPALASSVKDATFLGPTRPPLPSRCPFRSPFTSVIPRLDSYTERYTECVEEPIRIASLTPLEMWCPSNGVAPADHALVGLFGQEANVANQVSHAELDGCPTIGHVPGCWKTGDGGDSPTVGGSRKRLTHWRADSCGDCCVAAVPVVMWLATQPPREKFDTRVHSWVTWTMERSSASYVHCLEQVTAGLRTKWRTRGVFWVTFWPQSLFMLEPTLVARRLSHHGPLTI